MVCERQRVYNVINQLLTQTVNPCVPGSSPGRGAKNLSPAAMWGFLFLGCGPSVAHYWPKSSPTLKLIFSKIQILTYGLQA